jgi:hypothetical protein
VSWLRVKAHSKVLYASPILAHFSTNPDLIRRALGLGILMQCRARWDQAPGILPAYIDSISSHNWDRRRGEKRDEHVETRNSDDEVLY